MRRTNRLVAQDLQWRHEKNGEYKMYLVKKLFKH